MNLQLNPLTKEKQMKLSFKVLQVLLASTVAFNGVLSHAESEATAAVNIQTLQAQEIHARFASLVKHQAELDTYADVLAHAKEMEGGYQVALVYTAKGLAYAENALTAAVPARVFMQYKPDAYVTRTLKGLTNATLVVGGLTIVGAFAADAYSTYKLNFSKAEQIRATAKIANAQQMIDADKAFIAENSRKLGITVSNMIKSFEGLHLPDGLKMLGSPGTSLLLGDLNRMVGE
jgi:hypothetical protein